MLLCSLTCINCRLVISRSLSPKPQSCKKYHRPITQKFKSKVQSIHLAYYIYAYQKNAMIKRNVRYSQGQLLIAKNTYQSISLECNKHPHLQIVFLNFQILQSVDYKMSIYLLMSVH